jgi:hypothetical protein
MKRFNEWVAVKLTQGVGSMTCAYLFFIWSILPLAVPSMTNVVSYVSQSIIQLVLLSVIMVGQDIGNRRVEERAEQDHQAIMAEMAELKEMHEELHQLLKQKEGQS